MTITEARKRMIDFVSNRKYSSVLFASLSEEDKLTYVMLKSFNYYDFIKGSERIRRAIENAEAHKKSKFNFFMNNINEHMVIGG